MISKRALDTTSFMVMDVMAKAEALEKAGEHVVHLEVGEPDFDTPEVIRQAAVSAMDAGETHYTHALGLLALREAIAEHYYNTYNVSVSPDQVMVSTGTSPAMLIAMLSLIDPGDEIIHSNPGYACYPNFIRGACGTPVPVTTLPEDGFQYRPDAIKTALTPRTKGIIINSPANPTGVVMTKTQMENVAAFDNQIIISDEIYHGLVYEGEAHSILEFTDNAFVINGFSKLYAMTGWRLGYLIYPKQFIGPMTKLHQNYVISASSFVQRAAVTALKQAGQDVANMVKTYDKRRHLMITRLKALGFGIHVRPTGAFYVFADARSFCKDSYKEAFQILEKVKVGVTPGIDFGTGGEGFLRFSYANNTNNIEEGMRRIGEHLNNRC